MHYRSANVYMHLSCRWIELIQYIKCVYISLDRLSYLHESYQSKWMESLQYIKRMKKYYRIVYIITSNIFKSEQYYISPTFLFFPQKSATSPTKDDETAIPIFVTETKIFGDWNQDLFEIMVETHPSIRKYAETYLSKTWSRLSVNYVLGTW